jgi:hypothetical protein
MGVFSLIPLGKSFGICFSIVFLTYFTTLLCLSVMSRKFVGQLLRMCGTVDYRLWSHR